MIIKPLLLILVATIIVVGGNPTRKTPEIDSFWHCMKTQNDLRPEQTKDKVTIADFLKMAKNCLEIRSRDGKTFGKMERYWRDFFRKVSETEISISWDVLIRNRGTINLFVKSMAEETNSSPVISDESVDDYYYYL